MTGLQIAAYVFVLVLLMGPLVVWLGVMLHAIRATVAYGREVTASRLVLESERTQALERIALLAAAPPSSASIAAAPPPAPKLSWARTTPTRARVLIGYEALAAVQDEALAQAQSGKGHERHAVRGEAFADQQIVQLGEWMNSTAFDIGQACKKAIESTRLPDDRAVDELLGAMNYLGAAVLVIRRRNGGAR